MSAELFPTDQANVMKIFHCDKIIASLCQTVLQLIKFATINVWR